MLTKDRQRIDALKKKDPSAAGKLKRKIRRAREAKPKKSL